MELYIIRHGQTTWNEKGLLQGSVDIELNESGREVAGKMGEKLEDTPFDVIFSSPLIRAYETACLIRGHRNIPIIRDERLREICFGDLEGKNYREIFMEGSPYITFFTDPSKYPAPPGGETFYQVIERIGEFYKEVLLPAAKKYERIMVVAHGNANKGLIFNLENNTDVKTYWGPGLQKNGEADIFVFNGESWMRKPGTVPAVDEKWGRL